MDYSKDNSKKIIKSRKSKKTKLTNKLVTFIFRFTVIAAVIGIFAGISAGIGVYMGIIENSPSFDQLLTYIQPEIYTSIIYEEKTGREIDRLVGEENREYVTIDRIPSNLKNAFIAIEDERFFDHNGVDLKAFIRATYSTLFEDDTQGGSTITQQIIKNNVFKINRNTYITKIQEQYLAVNYEKWLTETLGSKQKAKEYILEIYLNTIGLANMLNGVQAAALRYFDKNVEDLTLAECAVIAAITQNPSKYSPTNRPEDNRYRQKLVLKKMLELGYITEAQRDAALEEDVYANIQSVVSARKQSSPYHSDFVDQLIRTIINDLQERLNYSLSLANYTLFNSGLQIYATVDMDMQKIVEEAYLNDALFPNVDYEISVTYLLTKKNQITGKVTNHEKTGIAKNVGEIDALVYKMQGELLGPDDVVVADLIQPVVQPQSAFAIVDYHTGQVKALAGGRGEKLADRVLNRSTQSPRQPGSVFKVLASYAPALDLGLITPATVYDDVPLYMESMEKYWPTNWYTNPKYRGLNNVRDGIRDSMNVLAVLNFLEVGAQNSYDYLKNFGFSRITDGQMVNGEWKTDLGPSTALGGVTNGVTTLELASAYGAIANLGEYIEPYLYTKVLNHGGEAILENKPESKRVLKQTTAYLLTDMMKDVITSGTGGRARFQSINMPQAGKTGTTSETIDLVFAGYTPYYSAAIWLGHDMPKAMKSKDYNHCQIWRYIMEEIHKDLPFKDFDIPDGIVTARICKDSGLLAVDGLCDADPRGSRIRNEKFVSGTQPSEYCEVHRSYTVDSETGLLFTNFCPAENRNTLVGIVRPVPYDGDEFIQDQPYEIPVSLLNGEFCHVHNPFTQIPDIPVIQDPLNNNVPYMPDDNTPASTQDGFRYNQ